MLRFREEAFSAQPNAVNSEYDCHLQMAHMLLLQLLKSRFVDYNSEGPFLLQFTDFHASNIFVDDDWNVVALIDLEFICALPADMMDTRYWLSVDAIDQIGAQMDAFGNMHKAFLDQFRQEENNFNHEHNILLASSIDKAWATYSFWFYSCLTCINGMDYFFQEHIYKKFGSNPLLQDEKQFVEQLSSFWPSDSKSFVKQKLHDKAKYNEDIARHFEGRLNTRSD